MDGIHSFSLGSTLCHILQDQAGIRTLEQSYPNVAPDEILEAAAAVGIDPFTIDSSSNCLLIELGGERILIDSGSGVDTGGQGRLFERLEALGIGRDDIDVVVLSHAHGDHYGGLIAGDGSLNFPKARHYMWGPEWEHYSSPGQLELERGEEGLASTERWFLPLGPHLTLLDESAPEVVAGLEVIPAPGHTRHHAVLELRSERQTLIVVGDAFFNPLSFHRPAWAFRFDHDPGQAEATRRALIDRAFETDALLLGYHFPFPGLGKLWRERTRAVWGPLRLS